MKSRSSSPRASLPAGAPEAGGPALGQHHACLLVLPSSRSYLYAHCLAAQLWKRHLAADPLGRAAGERLRRQLLEPGGARDPHDLLEGLFAPDGDAVLQEVDGGWHPDPSALLEASWA